MGTYIAMLRGINVSGKKKIKMADLTSMCTSAGLRNVRTYIQSGNVTFESTVTDPSRLTNLFETHIERTFGFSVATVIRTRSEMQKVVSRNPYVERAGLEPRFLYVTFLREQPQKQLLTGLQSLKDGGDEITVVGREVHGYFPNGYGRTKLSNAFIENRLKVSATTRNWTTVNTLVKMASE